jgi:hypothetical protein
MTDEAKDKDKEAEGPKGKGKKAAPAVVVNTHHDGKGGHHHVAHYEGEPVIKKGAHKGKPEKRAFGATPQEAIDNLEAGEYESNAEPKKAPKPQADGDDGDEE